MTKNLKIIWLSSSLLLMCFVLVLYNGPLAEMVFGNNGAYTLAGLIGTVGILLGIYFKKDEVSNVHQVFKINGIVILFLCCLLFAIKENIYILLVICTALAACQFINLVLLIELYARNSENKYIINNIGIVMGLGYALYHLVHIIIKLNLVYLSIGLFVLGIGISISLPLLLKEYTDKSKRLEFDQKLMTHFFIIFFLLNIRGGIAEASYEKTHNSILLSVMFALFYFALLVLLKQKIFKSNKLLYIGAFITFTVGQSIFLLHIGEGVAFIIISTAYAFFDIFTWGIMGYLAKIYQQPYKVIAGGILSGAMGSTIGNIIFYKTNVQISAIICNLFMVFSLLFIEMFFKKFKEVKGVYNFYNKVNLNSEGSLTNREQEVVKLLVMGMKNEDIANELCIAKSTLKVHCRNIYKKMQVNNKQELINLYYIITKKEEA